MTRQTHQHGWFISSYSGPQNNSCLQARITTDGTEIRDSKNPHGPTLHFNPTAWRTFLHQLPEYRPSVRH